MQIRAQRHVPPQKEKQTMLRPMFIFLIVAEASVLPLQNNCTIGTCELSVFGKQNN